MSATALIIEDEENIASSLKQLLTLRFAAQIDMAKSILEAELALGSHQYDLVIFDNFLPDGIGLEMVSRMADKYDWIYNCKLIFLSGVLYVDKTQAFLDGIEKFNRLHVRNKPISAQVLYDLVGDSLPLKPC